ncbi:MAG: phosphoglycerate kinase [Bacillota bacterium]
MKKTLKDYDFKNKKVLVRVDFNVPLDGEKVTDESRIEAALPTIKFLMNEDAKVILMSHLGRPGGKIDEQYRMDPVADKLADLLGKEIYKTDETIGKEVEKAIEKMNGGDVLLLENTRFHPGEKKNDSEYAKALAGLADVFVNDAFGAAHRAHASTTGVAEYLPAVAGFLIQRELEALGRATDNPEKPYTAIIGGAKVSDKMDVIKNIISKADYLLLGGGIANTFLLAKGLEVGDSLVEKDKVDLAKEIMDEAAVKGIEVILPDDVVIAREFKADSEYKTVDVEDIPKDWQILDSGGPKTLKKYKEIINKSKTVTWNGPIGVFEMDQFANGTMELAKALAESDAYSVVGGGESAAAIKKAGVKSDISHVSTGGGASLQFFEGKPLPGIEALDDLKE